jgi:hypothetical protein
MVLCGGSVERNINAKLYGAYMGSERRETVLISEVFVNKTKGHRFSETDPYEPFTDNIGELFNCLKKEYGKCVSNIYIDTTNPNKPKKIGWVFEKKMQYEDCKEFYIREVWVTLHEKPKEIKEIFHYKELK